MPNMSYCQFENTARDLQQCMRTLNDALEEGTTFAEFIRQMSPEELQAFKGMRQQCEQFVELHEAMEEA